MVKRRQILESVIAASNRKSSRILVFTGARQVGKTTLAKHALDGYTFISIEDPRTATAYLNLTASQWNQLYPRAILDEVQKEPTIIESIKAAYDQSDTCRYALLGSSQLLLMQKVKESLAGRCRIFDLYPLTLPELCTNSWDDTLHPSLWQQILAAPTEMPEFLPSFLIDPRMAQKQAAFDFYARFGAYPAIVDDDMTDDERYIWLGDYVRTYLERDIRDLAALRDLEPYVKLQHAIAQQTAQTVNASALASHIGISSKTVHRYIEYLNVSYQTIILPAWERNLNKRLSKTPKIHMIDNGVLQAILQKRGGLTGAEFESLIVSEIFKQAKNMLVPCSFYHLRTLGGKEIDLLVETAEGYFAFEIKQSAHVARTDARHLFTLADTLDKPLLHAFVVSNDVETHSFAPNVTAISAPMLLG